MHTDAVNSTGADAIVASAKARGVPVVSAQQMLTWLDGRNGSSFGSIAYSGDVLSFRVSVGAGATALRGMVPATFGGKALTGMTRDGAPITFTRETIKGVEYAFFPATTGDYTASYAPDTAPPAITGVVGRRCGGRDGDGDVDDRRGVGLARGLRHLAHGADAERLRRRGRDSPQRAPDRPDARHDLPLPRALGRRLRQRRHRAGHARDVRDPGDCRSRRRR